jgi:DNA-binding CsgD family transcriptional regulator
MNCHKCEKQLVVEDAHAHNGLFLCEDCYIDGVSLLKTCDPWAVYTASRTAAKGVSLTGEQQRIIDLLKVGGPVTLEEICSRLGLGEDEVRSHFSILRHMELVGACKRDEQVFFTLAAR